MRLRLLLASLAFGTLAGAMPLHAAQVVRVGIAPEPYMPYSTLNAANEWDGFEPAVVKAICERMQADCQYNAIAWDGLIPSLRESKVDLIIGAFSINEERRQVVDFSTPYDHETTVVIGSKSDDTEIGIVPNPEVAGEEILDPASLDGKIVGAQVASIQARYGQTYLTSSELKNYDTADNTAADLVAGRIDYALLPDVYADSFLRSPAGADYEVKKTIPKNAIMGEGIGAAMRKGDRELLEKVNQAIKSLEEDGTLRKLTQTWFPSRT